MKKQIVALLIAASTWVGLIPSVAGGAEVEGVTFSPSVRTAAGEALELRGVGLLRYRVLFKGYVAALYLADGPSESDMVPPDVGGRLEIEYFWKIRAEDFARVTLDGVSRNVDADTFASLEEPINRFNTFYRDVRPGDRYALTYLPGLGIELALNGERLGIIEGEELASAIFAIWFGDYPADESLKLELLGRS
jgi:hypothetical protein